MLLRLELVVNLFIEETSENVREFPSIMMVGTSEVGEIIGRDEESFIIVRQWAGMESMILITKKNLLRVEQ